MRERTEPFQEAWIRNVVFQLLQVARTYLYILQGRGKIPSCTYAVVERTCKYGYKELTLFSHVFLDVAHPMQITTFGRGLVQWGHWVTQIIHFCCQISKFSAKNFTNWGDESYISPPFFVFCCNFFAILFKFSLPVAHLFLHFYYLMFGARKGGTFFSKFSGLCPTVPYWVTCEGNEPEKSQKLLGVTQSLVA